MSPTNIKSYFELIGVNPTPVEFDIILKLQYALRNN